MEVILLERVAKLGQMGEVVRVRDGFARNFLLPRGKALRATKDNKSKFEGMKVELQAKSAAAKGDAGKVATKLDGKSFSVLRQASEVGQLYGSVSPRDIADVVTAGGFNISRNQVPVDKAIKMIGLHEVNVVLNPEVRVKITINVARTEDEADRQARGEDVLAEAVEEEAAEAPAAEALFEEGAGPKPAEDTEES